MLIGNRLSIHHNPHLPDLPGLGSLIIPHQHVRRLGPRVQANLESSTRLQRRDESGQQRREVGRVGVVLLGVAGGAEFLQRDAVCCALARGKEQDVPVLEAHGGL